MAEANNVPHTAFIRVQHVEAFECSDVQVLVVYSNLATLVLMPEVTLVVTARRAYLLPVNGNHMFDLQEPNIL